MGWDGDDGEVFGQKQPGNSFSGVGGSNASFEALRALFILSRQTIDVIGLAGLTPVTVLNGKPVAGDVDCNTKGAMLSDTMLRCARAHVGRRIRKILALNLHSINPIGGEEDANGAGDDAETTSNGRAKLTSGGLAVLPGGAMGEQGINFTQLKTAVGGY